MLLQMPKVFLDNHRLERLCYPPVQSPTKAAQAQVVITLAQGKEPEGAQEISRDSIEVEGGPRRMRTELTPTPSTRRQRL